MHWVICSGYQKRIVLPAFTASPCRPNPCQNGGSCMKGPKRSSFQCFCPNGYIGMFCEVGKCNFLTVLNRKPHFKTNSHPCITWLTGKHCFSRTKRLLPSGRRVLPWHGECNSWRGGMSGLEFLFYPAERGRSLQRVCRLWWTWTTQLLQVRSHLV